MKSTNRNTQLMLTAGEEDYFLIYLTFNSD